MLEDPLSDNAGCDCWPGSDGRVAGTGAAREMQGDIWRLITTRQPFSRPARVLLLIRFPIRLRRFCRKSDIIVLAAPVRTILALIPQLPDWHTGSPLVIDLGSTKTDICAALAQLPDRFRAVGGHPMCGKEFSSLAYADKHLYQLATFALCRLPASDQAACMLAEALVRAVGANPIWMQAENHDQAVAATSHMPFLAGQRAGGRHSSLCRCTDRPGVAQFHAPGRYVAANDARCIVNQPSGGLSSAVRSFKTVLIWYRSFYPISRMRLYCLLWRKVKSPTGR